MDCRNHLSFNLQSLPKEIFLLATVGELRNKPLCAAIRIFSQMRAVCSELKERVSSCWGIFIQQAGNSSLLLPPKKWIDPRKAQEFLSRQYPTLKKWEETNPEVKEAFLPGFMEQAVINNYLGLPELWVMFVPRKNMVCVDLLRQERVDLALSEEIYPISYRSNPCMATSKKWIAICCDNIDENKVEIEIVDISSGDRCYKITNVGKVSQLYCEGDFLYVLCAEASSGSKLLQYDGNDWSGLPKELCLPEKNVIKFYMSRKEILFSVSCVDGTYQLLAVRRDSCFGNTKPTFLTTTPELEYPLIKATDEGFLAISSIPATDSPSVALSQLFLSESTITRRTVQTFSADRNRVCDFLVHYDRIFLLEPGLLSVRCMNLTSGSFIKEFSPAAPHSYGTNFRPQLVSPSPERIQLLFSSMVPVSPGRVSMGNGLMTLDYKG